MKIDFKDIDDYINQQPETIQFRLSAIRQAIKKAAPEAEEVISYQMPAFKYYGMLVYFAAFKNHIGFYATPTGHSKFANALSIYKQGKGSVQFPHHQELPLELIEEIVAFRIQENYIKAKK